MHRQPDHRDHADLFAGYLCLQELADNTVRSYRALYQRWRDWAAMDPDADPDRPDAVAVRKWSNTIVGSRSLRAQARATVAHLCRMLQVDDVSVAVPVPRQPRKPRGRVLDHDDAVKLARAALEQGIAGVAVLVGMFTGARRSEIACLAWEDVDFDYKLVTFTRSKVSDRHTVPMHDQLTEILEQRWVPGETWVFPGRHGGHVSPATIGVWVEQVARTTDVGHVTPHVLRRTAGTEANDNSRDLRAVQDLLGHTDPGVTAGYTRVNDQRMREAVNSFDWLDG